jgi:hypothetical protein
MGRFGLVTGDVAGKGIAAALLMSNLQANLQIQCDMALEQAPRGCPLGREGLPWPGSKRLCCNPLADARGSDSEP